MSANTRKTNANTRKTSANPISVPNGIFQLPIEMASTKYITYHNIMESKICALFGWYLVVTLAL